MSSGDDDAQLSFFFSRFVLGESSAAIEAREKVRRKSGVPREHDVETTSKLNLFGAWSIGFAAALTPNYKRDIVAEQQKSVRFHIINHFGA